MKKFLPCKWNSRPWTKLVTALSGVGLYALLIPGCVTTPPPQPAPPVVQGPTDEEKAREEAKQKALAELERKKAAVAEERRAVEQEVAARVKAASGKNIPDYGVVDILYATDRLAINTVNKGWTEVGYGPDRGQLQYGIFGVGMPRDLRADPLEPKAVVKTKPAEEFFFTLQERVAQSKRKEVLVFVHGYYTAFDEAARRTAQLAYALGFPGVAVLYSWPSQAALTGYLTDETNIEWTIPHFREFLKQVKIQSGADRICVIAHSMGNRALIAALRQLAADPLRPDSPIVHELVLMAPDVDADIFRDAMPEIRPVVGRVTLYSSSQDKALLISKTVHGYQRAGDTKPTIVIVPGVDTIDASAADTSVTGHSYYADSRSVLFDLYTLLRHGDPPEIRFGLLPKEQSGQRYWMIQP
jgi:esterase/lipase superfamily enzyme